MVELYDDSRYWAYTDNLALSPNLAHIIGFRKYEASIEFAVEFKETLTHVAPHEPDLFLLHPRNLIICCG